MVKFNINVDQHIYVKILVLCLVAGVFLAALKLYLRNKFSVTIFLSFLQCAVC